MMKITVDHNGRRFPGFEVADLVKRGVPSDVIAREVKRAASEVVTAFAESYRARLASSSAGKLAEYRIKEEIARDPDNASEAELALITREAEARGTDRDGLLNDIAEKALAYRQVALLIGALEAETNAAISAIPDDAADIEKQTETVLEAAKAQAETAFAEALALMNGGS